MLLVSRKPMTVGDEVQCSLHISAANEAPWILRGRVVRTHTNVADPGGLWPHKVAVAFDAPVPSLVESVMAS